MKIIFPDKIKLKLEKIGNVKWKLNYVERFVESDTKAIEAAKALIIQASKTMLAGELKVRRLRDGLSISIEGTRQQVYNYVVSEFLPESSMGKRTLGDVFNLLAVMTAVASPEKIKTISDISPDSPIPGITGEVRKEDSKEVS